MKKKAKKSKTTKKKISSKNKNQQPETTIQLIIFVIKNFIKQLPKIVKRLLLKMILTFVFVMIFNLYMVAHISKGFNTNIPESSPVFDLLNIGNNQFSFAVLSFLFFYVLSTLIAEIKIRGFKVFFKDVLSIPIWIINCMNKSTIAFNTFFIGLAFISLFGIVFKNTYVFIMLTVGLFIAISKQDQNMPTFISRILYSDFQKIFMKSKEKQSLNPATIGVGLFASLVGVILLLIVPDDSKTLYGIIVPLICVGLVIGVSFKLFTKKTAMFFIIFSITNIIYYLYTGRVFADDGGDDEVSGSLLNYPSSPGGMQVIKSGIKPGVSGALGVAISSITSSTSAVIRPNGINIKSERITEPYPSDNPSDPEGTMLQNNNDGSITKTNTDGTVVTKYPDGTVKGIAADGTQITIDPDKTEVHIQEDGTKTIYSPDGSIEKTDIDGTISKVDANGNATIFDTDGCITHEKSDGSSIVEFPNGDKNHFDTNGDLIRRDRKTGSIIFEKDGSFKVERINKDGSIMKGVIDKDGTVIVEDIAEDGSIMTSRLNKDGSTIIEGTSEDGTIVKGKFDSNNTGEIYTDDGTRVIYKDGKIIECEIKTEEFEAHQKDGVTSIKEFNDKGEFTEKRLNKDGSAIFKDDYGNDIIVNKDGTVEGTVIYENGKVEYKPNNDFSAEYKDGMTEKLVTNPDGTSTLTRIDKDGNTTIMQNDLDGNTTMVDANGKTYKMKKDNSMTTVDANGKVEHFQPDEVKKMLHLGE